MTDTAESIRAKLQALSRLIGEQEVARKSEQETNVEYPIITSQGGTCRVQSAEDGRDVYILEYREKNPRWPVHADMRIRNIRAMITALKKAGIMDIPPLETLASLDSIKRGQGQKYGDNCAVAFPQDSGGLDMHFTPSASAEEVLKKLDEIITNYWKWEPARSDAGFFGKLVKNPVADWVRRAQPENSSEELVTQYIKHVYQTAFHTDNVRIDYDHEQRRFNISIFAERRGATLKPFARVGGGDFLTEIFGGYSLDKEKEHITRVHLNLSATDALDKIIQKDIKGLYGVVMENFKSRKI